MVPLQTRPSIRLVRYLNCPAPPKWPRFVIAGPPPPPKKVMKGGHLQKLNHFKAFEASSRLFSKALRKSVLQPEDLFREYHLVWQGVCTATENWHSVCRYRCRKILIIRIYPLNLQKNRIRGIYEYFRKHHFIEVRNQHVMCWSILLYWNPVANSQWSIKPIEFQPQPKFV